MAADRGLDAMGESQEVLRGVIDAAPNGLMVVDEGGSIVLANLSAGRLFGRSVGDLLGRSVDELVPAVQRRRHVTHRRDYSGDPSARPMGEGRHLRALRSDGSTFITEIALSPLQVDGSTMTVVVIRDITARVSAEQEARREQAWNAVLDDRRRIARDLHDHVIQALFGAGLQLAHAQSELPEPTQTRVADVIEQLDDAIHRLRDAVFRLHRQGRVGDEIGHEASRFLGFEPDVKVNGDTDLLAGEIRVELEGVIREALSNVARHAQASAVSVVVDISDHELAVTVADNGVGFDSRHLQSGTGLRSMRERAELFGGSMALEGLSDGGTVVYWRIPLAHPTA